MRRRIAGGLLLGLLLVSSGAQAFDVVDEKLSYLENRFITLSLGLGFTDFALQSGVQGGAGFGLHVGVGHHFNRYLSAEIVYQFSMLDLTSPDPVFPNETLTTGSFMNQEMLRFVWQWPDWVVQPYVSAGIGGYNLYSVNKSTALDFSTNFELPLAGGIRAYVFRDRISLDAEVNYNILFGENQSPSTLALLGIPKVEFDSYSFFTTVTFHL